MTKKVFSNFAQRIKEEELSDDPELDEVIGEANLNRSKRDRNIIQTKAEAMKERMKKRKGRPSTPEVNTSLNDSGPVIIFRYHFLIKSIFLNEILSTGKRLGTVFLKLGTVFPR